MGTRILVTSGKGGTGKTSLTASLAASLASLDRKVCCIDLDVGLRNLDIVLGLTDKTAMDFSDVLSGAVKLEEAVCPHPNLPTLHLLPAPSAMTSTEIPVEAFAQMTRRLAERYDYVFLDSPSGLENGFRIGAASSDRAIVVSLLEVAALRDAARVAEALEQEEIHKAHLVLNRVRPQMVRDYETMNVDDAMDTTGLPLLGIIPEDIEVIVAGNHGVPLVFCSHKGAARAVMNIAKRLEGQYVPISERNLKVRT